MTEKKKAVRWPRSLLRLFIVLRRLFQTAALLLLLLVIGFFLLNSSRFLDWSRSQIMAVLNETLDNRLEYGHLDFNFFKGAEISDLIIYDHHQDTLFCSRKINISLARSLMSLFRRELAFNELTLQDGILFIHTYNGESSSSLDIFLDQFRSQGGPGGKKLVFNISSAALRNIEVHRTDDNTGNSETIFAEEIRATVHRMDLLAHMILVDRIDLHRPRATIIRTGKTSPVAPTVRYECNDSTCVDPMLVICEQVNLSEGTFEMKNLAFPADSLRFPHFQQGHFFASGIELRLNQLFSEAGIFTSAGMNASFRLNDQLDINTLQYQDLSIRPEELNITRFRIMTENSRIGDSLYLRWSEEPDADWKENTFVDFKLRDSRISSGDLLYFLPALNNNAYLAGNKELQAEIAAHLSGRINSLKAFGLAVDIPNKLEFKGDAFTRNITDKGEELLNLNIRHLLSNSGFIKKLVPTLEKVKVFDQLGQFKYSGRFDGYLEDFVSYGTFVSDLGVFRSDIRLNLRPGSERATWSGSLQLQDFNLGGLLQSRDLGKVSMKADIRNGIGLHIDNMSAEMKGDIQSLVFKDYNYQNIRLDATVNKNLFDGFAQIKDKNLDCTFKGKVADLRNVPKLLFSADIGKLDLKALHLSEKSLILSGRINADITDIDPNKIQGRIGAEEALIYDYEKNRVLSIGEIKFSQASADGESNTTLRSDFANFDARGEYRLKSVYDQLMTYLNAKYPDIFSDLGLRYNPSADPFNIRANIELRQFNELSSFLDLNIKTSDLHGKIMVDSRKNIIESDFRDSYLHLGNIKLNDLLFTMNGDNGKLDARLQAASLKNGNRTMTGKTTLSSYNENNVTHVALMAMDSLDQKEKYRLQIGFVKNGARRKFHLEGEDILVAGSRWEYNEVSSLELGKEFISLHQFEIFDSVSTIELSDLDNKGLRISANAFDLSLINDLIKGGSLTFTGLFDINLDVKDIFRLSGVEGQLNILNMRINKVSYGRFDIDFSMNDPRMPLALKVTNNFKETSINMAGTLNLPLTKDYVLPKFDFDFQGTATGFQLYFLESFITSISDTRGTLTGPIRIRRENKQIFMDGECIARDASAKVDYLNTTYRFDGQKIRFEKDLIIFDNNAVNDELGNPIGVNGTIRHDDLTYFDLDIMLKSKKALVLNTTKKDNIYYYGNALMNFQCSFRGLTSKLDMDFKGRSEKGSKFVIPVRYEQESGDTKFIHFRERDTTARPLTATPVVIKGLNVRMDIEMTDDCEMSIIFDEKNGDILRGNGVGNIQVAALRDNTFDIKGNYEINAGQYLFTLMNFVNKPFKIKKGGTIRWTGDPLNADINIEAGYDGINISPATLLEEYAITDPTIQNRIRERTKVDLSMLLRGSLLKPDIDFKLGFPDLSGSIRNLADTKVRSLEQNPEQMNQQVASLILFRTFISSNASIGLQAGVQTTTASTLTEFLSNQASIFFSSLLSDLYQKVDFISGVDINVNYDINKSIAGTQSNASEWVFNVRHRLWNDQWAVSIGGNYGNSSAFNRNSSYFNPESAIEWNTPVPGLKVRIYYKGTDGIDGTRHRAGTGVSYRKEFNNLLDFKKALREKKDNSGAK